MRPLTAVEQFFERLFERPTARLFRTRLQPVQLQRRIERAMENERLSGAGRTLVPNRFRVYLRPDVNADAAPAGTRSDAAEEDPRTGTALFTVPRQKAPSARLRMIRPDGTE